MTRPHSASIPVMRAIDQLGPNATDEQLAEATDSNPPAISNRLWWLTGKGFLHKVGKGPDRVITITEEGREFLANPVRSEAKPREKNYGPPKRRGCLKCRARFTSRWPGERVCGECKETREWRDGYDPEQYTVLGGRP